MITPNCKGSLETFTSPVYLIVVPLSNSGIARRSNTLLKFKMGKLMLLKGGSYEWVRGAEYQCLPQLLHRVVANIKCKDWESP